MQLALKAVRDEEVQEEIYSCLGTYFVEFRCYGHTLHDFGII